MSKETIVVFSILLLILIVGTVVRVYKLSDIPPGLFADEAVVGVDAYSILTTGTDHYGEKYPIFFRAFDDFRGPSGVYTAIPFVALLGLNEFAIRLNSAVFGVISILAIYFLVMQMLKNHPGRRAIALLSSLFLAIAPWHIHFSRTGWGEFMPYVLFTILAIYFFFKAEDNEWWLPVSFAMFAIATYTYTAARIFVPIFGVCFAIFRWRFLLSHKRATLAGLFVLAVLLTPFVIYHLRPETLSRWNAVNIFSKPHSDESVLHHIVVNYLDHFSTNFLFIQGDAGNIRHSVRGMGLLYLFQLPLIAFGFLALCRKQYKYVLGALVIWLLIYPFGNAFTADRGAQAMRSLIGMVPFQIFAAIGLYSIFHNLSKLRTYSPKLRIVCWIFALVMAGIIVMAFAQYLKLYFVEYPTYASGWSGWQSGSKEILTYFMSVENEYDDLYMAPAFNGPDIFYLFYTQNHEKGCNNCRNGVVGDWYNPARKQLFALPPDDLQKFNVTMDVKKTIYYSTGEIAFLIGEVKK